VPQVLPEQPAPLRLHVTAVFVVLITVAENCLVLPATTCAVVGEMLTATGGRIVTVAVLDFKGFATEVAVTVTTAGVGTVLGAAYTPADETTPHAASEQPLPVTLQVTAVLVAPVTNAVKSC
jgi:hypothetical protein